MNEIKTISFGGLGDSWIVYLKLVELCVKNKAKIDHLHVESNGIVPQLIQEYQTVIPTPFNNLINFKAATDQKYEKNFNKGKYKGRLPINTTWHGNYNFPAGDSGLEYPFLDLQDSTKHYDICLQVSAGAKSDRQWPFDPFMLKNALASMGYKVVLIGNDNKYENQSDPFNFVNKVNLSGSLGILLCSRLVVALSGFIVYYSLSNKINTICKPESDDHIKHYYHPLWTQFVSRLNSGAIQEIIQQARIML